MVFPIPFLIATAELPPSSMLAGAKAISSGWGGSLIQLSCTDDPIKTLKELPQVEGLAQLNGDAAMKNSFGDSWMESLGFWRQPVLLMTCPTLSGDIPGSASAHVALCSVLSISLIGIVQVGGEWDVASRRSDGLPWCGWLPDRTSLQSQEFDDLNSDINISGIINIMRKRILFLGLG